MATHKKRTDGYYQKTIYLGRKANGQYIRKTIYGKTLKDLNSKVTDVTMQLNNGIRVWEKDVLFSELATIWVEQYHPTESERWYQRQKTIINKHLLPYLGGMKICDLRQINLQTVISRLAKKNYATSTMKKIKQTATRIMAVAVESDLILKNPFINVKVPKKEPQERRALTEKEIHLITDNWAGYRFGHGAMIMLYAGLRRGEVLALEWDDIDFEKRVIHVNKSVEILRNKPRIKRPKTKAGTREVPMPEILYDALYSIKKKKGLVCPDTKGKLMTSTAYNRTWDSYLSYLNVCAGGKRGTSKKDKPIWVIERFTAHMLRHTYATMLFDAGVDVKSAQRFLGHADVEVTLNIYTHLTQFKEDAAVIALNNHVNNRYLVNEEAQNLKLVKGNLKKCQ